MSAVKQKCRLSLNLPREHSVSETLHVKSQRAEDSYHAQKLEMTEISLSSELFLAPEMMFASLDLPARVAEATQDLPDHLLKECFSNILVTGNNFSLVQACFYGILEFHTLTIPERIRGQASSTIKCTNFPRRAQIFLAPEMMFASLDLPARVTEATQESGFT